MVGARRHCDHRARKVHNDLGSVTGPPTKCPTTPLRGPRLFTLCSRDRTARTAGQRQDQLHAFHNSGLRGPRAASPGAGPTACLPAPRAAEGASERPRREVPHGAGRPSQQPAPHADAAARLPAQTFRGGGETRLSPWGESNWSRTEGSGGGEQRGCSRR